MLSELRRPIPETCLSDLVFDELHAGELDESSARLAEQHLASCARCAEQQQALLAAEGDFLTRYPEAPSSARHPVPRPSRRAYVLLTTSVALAAGLALFLPARRAPEVAQVALETRAKGASRLGFHVKRGEHVFRGANGERVHGGDQLRFVVTNAAQRQVAVLSRDGSGAATVYYPAQSHSRALGAAPETDLDAAVQLDFTVGEETLFGVFCDSEFELEPLRAALEHSGRVPTMKGCTVDELRIIKEAP
jgi:hypothetical protein